MPLPGYERTAKTLPPNLAGLSKSYRNQMRNGEFVSENDGLHSENDDL